MHILILAALCLECVILAILAYIKKLTRKIFVGISTVTLFCCIFAIVLSNKGYSEAKIEKQEENIYLAARLVQEDEAESAQGLLGKAIDSEYEGYGIKNLRGLIFQMTESYDTTLIYLEGAEDDLAQSICLAAKNKTPVEEEIKDEVTTQTISALALDEITIDRLEAQLQLQYLNELEEEEEQEEGEKTSVKESREKHFTEVMEGADSGDLEDIITLANLYIENYTLTTLSEKDEEYDRLLQEATTAQIRLNQAAVNLSDKQQETEDEEDSISEEEKEYAAVLAEYNIILEEMYQERVKRAINYLKANEPRNAETNTAYQMQLAALYSYSADNENAMICLDNIFKQETIDIDQWIGLDCFLLRETYLEARANGAYKEFELLYRHMMSNLGQSYNQNFLEFLKEYLESLFGGLVVGKIDYSEFPWITASVSVSDETIVLNAQNILVADTEVLAEEIEISEKEISELSICFVLDRSGSMSGNNIKDSKKAIRENVVALDENTEVALVSFDHEARVDCALTDVKFAVSAAVESIYEAGGTDIAAGLQTAREVLTGAKGERIIILLSDGYDGETEKMAEILPLLKADGIKVFTIGLSGSDEKYLANMAETTGGVFISVDKTGKLTEIYEEIRNYISYTYFVKYQVVQTEEEMREFHIQLKDSMIQMKKDYSVIETTVVETEPDVQKSNFYRQTGAAVGGGIND